MRGARVLVITVCAAAVLAGCGEQVDTAKQTYTRTTVPAAEANNEGDNTSETGKPKANDPAFTMEKIRALNPCGLLTNDILAAVGTPAENRPLNFGECGNYMKDKDEADLNITIYVGESVDNAGEADLNLGGLPGLESEGSDGEACFVTVVTSTSPNFGIQVQTGGKSKDLCEVGRTVLTSVVNLIRDDPPTRTDEQGSIAAVDPCEILDEAAVKTTLGVEASIDPYTLHWCDWVSDDGAKLGIWLRTGYDPKETSSGTPVDLGGVPAYQENNTAGGVSCSLEWMHRATSAEDAAELVEISVDKPAPVQGDICVTAQAAAKLVIAALPKP